MEREGGALSREIKRLNFGQFLFLYFVARNTDFEFVQCLLQKLIDEHAPEWSKTKAQKTKDERKKEQIPLKNVTSKRSESGLPPYDDSEYDGNNREPQAPPLPTKGNTYPELPNTSEVQDYSSTPTMRKRNNSTGGGDQ